MNCSATLAIPVSDACWDDALELGRHPTFMGFPYTYFDLVAAPKNSALDRVLQASAVANATTVTGVCALTSSSFSFFGST